MDRRVTLTVKGAEKRDAGRGVARVPESARRALGVLSGDPPPRVAFLGALHRERDRPVHSPVRAAVGFTVPPRRNEYTSAW